MRHRLLYRVQLSLHPRLKQSHQNQPLLYQISQVHQSPGINNHVFHQATSFSYSIIFEIDNLFSFFLKKGVRIIHFENKKVVIVSKNHYEIEFMLNLLKFKIMYKKIKLFLTVTVLTVLVFSCEKANVVPVKSEKPIIENTDKAARLPSVVGDLTATCSGGNINFLKNSIRVELDYKTWAWHGHVYNYEVYAEGVEEPIYELFNITGQVVFLTSGLFKNNTEYQVIITSVATGTSNAVPHYEGDVFSYVTTLNCVIVD